MEAGDAVTTEHDVGGGPFHDLGRGLVSRRGLCDMFEHDHMVVQCARRLLGLEWRESSLMGRCSERKQVRW